MKTSNEAFSNIACLRLRSLLCWSIFGNGARNVASAHEVTIDSYTFEPRQLYIGTCDTQKAEVLGLFEPCEIQKSSVGSRHPGNNYGDEPPFQRSPGDKTLGTCLHKWELSPARFLPLKDPERFLYIATLTNYVRAGSSGDRGSRPTTRRQSSS